MVLIIGTKDRNLALLIGRALDAQKFFHDVNYEHRLRDSPNELYQFQHPPNNLRLRQQRFVPEEEDEEDEKSEFNFMDNVMINNSHDDIMPNGVFTLLTDCYSPTCTRENLCYSVFCPRRLEQVRKCSFWCFFQPTCTYKFVYLCHLKVHVLKCKVF